MKHSQIQIYLRAAYQTASEFSEDDNTKVGAVIPDADIMPIVGVNRFSSPAQNVFKNLERVRKYDRIVHAEMDAICKAVKKGVSLQGCTMVLPWSPCSNCALCIVMSGITRVITHKSAMNRTPDRWKKSLKIANEILQDANVQRIEWFGDVGGCTNLFDGKTWEP